MWEIDVSLWENLSRFAVNNETHQMKNQTSPSHQFPAKPKKCRGTKNNHPQMLEGSGTDIHQAHCQRASHPSKETKRPKNQIEEQ